MAIRLGAQRYYDYAKAFGYGTTLGNSLRRVLLSSLPGTAVTSIRIAVDALTPEERYLWDKLLSDKTKAKIAEECGLSEGAIRKRVKKLAQTLRENPALKNYFE